MKYYFLFCFLIISALTSCDTEENKVELKVKDGGLERSSELHIYDSDKKVEKAISDERLKELEAKLKTKGQLLKNSHYRFVSFCRGVCDNEYNGKINFHSIGSKMGTCYYYSERISGNDDTAGEIEKDFAAVENGISILSDWLSKEFSDSKHKELLTGFIQNDLQLALKNLLLYVIIYKDEKEVVARFAQYLNERLQLDLSNLGKIKREFLNSAIKGTDADLKVSDTAQMLEFIRFAMLKRFKDIPEVVAFLKSRPFDENSFTTYLRALPKVKNYLAEYKKKQELKGEEEIKEPGLFDILFEGRDIIHFSFSSGGKGRYDFSLKLSHGLDKDSIITNGELDLEKGLVTWSGHASAPNKISNYPFAYALWSKPNTEFQKKRFGKVLLKKEKLFNYCVFVNSLNPEERKEWEKAIDELTPSSNAHDYLSEYPFKWTENHKKVLDFKSLLDLFIKSDNEKMRK